MTQAVISLDEGLAIARDVLGKIKDVNRDAVICGGFPRDVQLGVAPKDIDVFITSGVGIPPGVEANRMFAALGYTGIRELGGADATYEDGLTVFELTKEGSYPIQLVFSPPYSPHPLKFDFGICETYLWSDNETFENSNSHQRDVLNKTLTIRRGRDSYVEQGLGQLDSRLTDKDIEKFLDHMHRLTAKYPEHRVVMCAEYLKREQGRQLYNHLVQEGYFEDPRALFPTQRRDVEGDEIRLQDGREGGAEAGTIEPAEVGAEAIPGGVPDQPQVQPRPTRPALTDRDIFREFLVARDRERAAGRFFAAIDEADGILAVNLRDDTAD